MQNFVVDGLLRGVAEVDAELVGRRSDAPIQDSGAVSLTIGIYGAPPFSRLCAIQSKKARLLTLMSRPLRKDGKPGECTSSYADALEKAYGRKVKEKYLYLFSLDREVKVEDQNNV